MAATGGQAEGKLQARLLEGSKLLLTVRACVEERRPRWSLLSFGGLRGPSQSLLPTQPRAPTRMGFGTLECSHSPRWLAVHRERLSLSLARLGSASTPTFALLRQPRLTAAAVQGDGSRGAGHGGNLGSVGVEVPQVSSDPPSHEGTWDRRERTGHGVE